MTRNLTFVKRLEEIAEEVDWPNIDETMRARVPRIGDSQLAKLHEPSSIVPRYRWEYLSIAAHLLNRPQFYIFTSGNQTPLRLPDDKLVYGNNFMRRVDYPNLLGIHLSCTIDCTQAEFIERVEKQSGEKLSNLSHFFTTGNGIGPVKIEAMLSYLHLDWQYLPPC